MKSAPKRSLITYDMVESLESLIRRLRMEEDQFSEEHANA